jgi:cytochrome c
VLPKCRKAARLPLFRLRKKKEKPLQTALRWVAVTGLLCVAAPVRADYDLAVSKNCLACHYVDKRKYGPSFQQIAAKYADQQNAAEVLAKKIRRGGTGVWGVDVMPAQPQVSVTEARALATYVLSVK